VTCPGTSTFVANGSGPLPPGLKAEIMIPIDSYQEERFVS
jgi:hypothetical protein